MAPHKASILPQPAPNTLSCTHLQGVCIPASLNPPVHPHLCLPGHQPASLITSLSLLLPGLFPLWPNFSPHPQTVLSTATPTHLNTFNEISLPQKKPYLWLSVQRQHSLAQPSPARVSQSLGAYLGVRGCPWNHFVGMRWGH